MAHETNEQVSVRPAEAARLQFETARRRPLGGYLLVATIALATGVGATWLILSAVSGSPAAHGSAQAASSDAAVATSGEHAKPQAPTDKTAAQSEKAVYVSPARQQLIGVRTAEVMHRALETTIRTVGVVAYDETRVAEIHTKIAGWVERLHVDFVGKAVRRGQPLFCVYSPELVSTQKEYLLALKAQAQLGESRFAETRDGASSLVAAARERLHLWDISDEQIAELARTGQPRKTLTLYSPFDGVVLERNAFPGHYITPEISTFKIADLSTIWVLGQIFEYELSMVKLGQQVEIQFPYGQATRTLKGRITYIYPEVDATTRRVKVRIEFRNPWLQFKPESYVTVVVRTGAGHRLAVPTEAVIDTGESRYVILARGNGYFEPRAVQIGEPVDEFYPVIDGLTHGDVVVTSAQFLIDSESNLRAAMQSMAGHGHGGGASMPQSSGAPATPADRGAGHSGPPRSAASGVQGPPRVTDDHPKHQ